MYNLQQLYTYRTLESLKLDLYPSLSSFLCDVLCREGCQHWPLVSHWVLHMDLRSHWGGLMENPAGYTLIPLSTLSSKLCTVLCNFIIFCTLCSMSTSWIQLLWPENLLFTLLSKFLIFTYNSIILCIAWALQPHISVSSM